MKTDAEVLADAVYLAKLIREYAKIHPLRQDGSGFAFMPVPERVWIQWVMLASDREDLRLP